jgi:excinuclease UvrABC nuclease subunit
MPYLGRTALLRRRLGRLLGGKSQYSRLLNLRGIASRVEYQFTASWLENSMVFYTTAREQFPSSYLKLIRLRMPAYVKLLLSNPFPRSQVATRLSGARAAHYGPFRTRSAAGLFESQLLDLFQIRRCQEDLTPSVDHMGCIYGEMNMCLRPCQLAVSHQEYNSEVQRVARFLSSDGRSLLDAARRSRDEASQETDFESAATLHKQVERIEAILRARDPLSADVERLSGVAVTPSMAEGCVELWFMLRGAWLSPVRFVVVASGEKPVSLDRRLRGEVDSLIEPELTARQREEHLALLVKWYHSSRRDGEWLPFESLGDIPYRRLVRAVSRVASSEAAPCERCLPH